MQKWNGHSDRSIWYHVCAIINKKKWSNSHVISCIYSNKKAPHRFFFLKPYSQNPLEYVSFLLDDLSIIIKISRHYISSFSIQQCVNSYIYHVLSLSFEYPTRSMSFWFLSISKKSKANSTYTDKHTVMSVAVAIVIVVTHTTDEKNGKRREREKQSKRRRSKMFFEK